MQGYTALDTVIERLASKAESGQSYELEEEHKAVRELLRREMKRLGYEPSRLCSQGNTDERITAGERKSDSGRRQSHQRQAQKQVRNFYRLLGMCLLGAVGSASVS